MKVNFSIFKQGKNLKSSKFMYKFYYVLAL